MLVRFASHRLRGFTLVATIAALATATQAHGEEMPWVKPLPQAPAASVAPHSLPPYAGHVNHAYSRQPFHWGYFGAERYYPRVQWARHYNGEVSRRSLYRRY